MHPWAPSEDSQVVPHSLLHPVAEAATTDVFETSGESPSPHTWADMAWADSPARAPEISGEDRPQEDQPQPEIAAPVDDETILAELRYPATQADEVPAFPETGYTTTETTTSAADWASEAQPQAEAVGAAANDASPAESQIIEPQAALEAGEETSGSSASAGWTSTEEEHAESVATVASSYEMSAAQSESAAEMGEPARVESEITESAGVGSEIKEPAVIESIVAAVDETMAENKPEAAFAATASIGYGFRSIAHDEPVSPPTPPDESAAAAAAGSHETSPEREAELAAAWAHWKQIRESIASPQFTSQVADVAAAGFREIQRETPASPQPATETAATPAAEDDPNAIASIVDSVLADLRPKLVAEIARKLGREKK
jgi:hypothetical protein